MNWYAYVGNDPLNATDPTGEAKLKVGVEATLVVIGGARIGASISVDFDSGDISTEIYGGPRLGVEGGFDDLVGGELEPQIGLQLRGGISTGPSFKGTATFSPTNAYEKVKRFFKD